MRSGSHLKDIWESFGRLLCVIWMTSGSHLGDVRSAELPGAGLSHHETAPSFAQMPPEGPKTHLDMSLHVAILLYFSAPGPDPLGLTLPFGDFFLLLLVKS